MKNNHIFLSSKGTHSKSNTSTLNSHFEAINQFHDYTKKVILLLVLLFGSITLILAQTKKDGTPDMRYSSNKQTYGNSYSTTTTTTYTNNNVRYQSGYTNNNGTYVESHYKTTNNNTNWDNFSSKDNYNPYTGSTGSKAKDYTPDAYNYGSGKTIYEGPKGGQYYYNDNGNKVYVPKR
ncbi:MAG: hypothetical protein PHY85_02110 [Bacteroidales bacterium]|nr:hypothetical protein [Bacteroidales bacterium]